MLSEINDFITGHAALLGVVVGALAVIVAIPSAISSLASTRSGARGRSAAAEGGFDEVAQARLLETARNYANDVAGWFKERFDLMQDYAGKDAMRSNDAGRIQADLRKLNGVISGVPGGLYVLNADGLVIGQYSPHAPTAGDITGKYVAKEREYFKMSLHALHPIVCNAFRSADRDKEILVMAVRRYAADGTFIGILDAVVDVDQAPFSQMAAAQLNAMRAGSGTQLRGRTDLRLILLDANLRLIGSSDGPVSGRTGEEGNAAIMGLIAGLRHRSEHSGPTGALVCVPGTPFYTVLCADGARG